MNDATPETDAEDRTYPLPEYLQLITFEGSECAVLAPEEYEELYQKARRLERERNQARSERDELNARLIERTQAYEAKDARQIRTIIEMQDRPAIAWRVDYSAGAELFLDFDEAHTFAAKVRGEVVPMVEMNAEVSHE